MPRWLSFVTSFFLFLGVLMGPVVAEKRLALVIGNDRYANLPVLQKAANDAEAVGNTLARLGFEVIRGRDLGRQGMIDKLAEFTARIEAGDTALFFYAGHGVALGGINYLVPSDVPAATAGAEARVRGASIAEPDIIAEIQAKGARVAVLVLDACRDNPFPRAGTRTLGNTRGLADARPARGVFTLYSAGIGQTALDRLEPNDRNPNSVFTRVFVEQLAKPGLHIGDLAIEVREKVAEIALKARNNKGDADPHEQTPAYYDQTIGGRVFLAGLPSAKPETPKVSAPKASPIEPDPCAFAETHWRSSEANGTLEAFEDHLRRFSTCSFSALARAKIEALKKVAVAAAPAQTPAREPPSENQTGVFGKLLGTILGPRATSPPTLMAHILLQPLEYSLTDWEQVSERLSKMSGVRLVMPIVEGTAAASSPFYSTGVLVRGVRGADLTRFKPVSEKIRQGSLQDFERGVVIERRLADQLSVRVGDTMALIVSASTTPRVKNYPIVAVFDNEGTEKDYIVFMPLAESQAYFNRRGDTTAIEIYVAEPDKVELFRSSVISVAARPFYIIDWRQRTAAK